MNNGNKITEVEMVSIASWIVVEALERRYIYTIRNRYVFDENEHFYALITFCEIGRHNKRNITEIEKISDYLIDTVCSMHPCVYDITVIQNNGDKMFLVELT